MTTTQITETPRCGQCGSRLDSAGARATCLRCALDAVLQAEDLPGPSGSQPGPESPPCLRRFGDYELLAEVARGGMGVVYRARHVGLNREVALKMVLFGQFAGPETLERFQAEARTGARLRHAHIVAIHDLGALDGLPWFTMDLIDGHNLGDAFPVGPPAPREAAQLLHTVTEAVAYAHGQGVLHRDLKPSNILLDSLGHPHVTDFGLARLLSTDSSLTRTGQALGSPNYMAPEQTVGARKTGVAADIWSLGAILHFLLTGRPPFGGASVADTLRAVREDDPISPRRLNARIPADLETICLKCLEKEPAKRYAAAQELADDLGHFLAGEPVHARPVTRVERAWRWCRRKPALATAIVAAHLLLLALLIGGPVLTYRINQARKAETAERIRAEAQALKARQFQYASDMNLAHQAVDDGDLFRATQLLERWTPNSLITDNRSLTTDLRGWEWHYLERQCHGEELFILGAHTNGVGCVGFLPDGTTVFVGGYDGRVRLWDFAGRRELTSLEAGDRVVAAAGSPDGHWLAVVTQTPGGDQTAKPVQVWDLATRTEVAIVTTNFWAHSVITFSPDSKLLAFVDQFAGVVLWDVAARREVVRLPVFFPYLGPLGLAFSPDGKVLAYSAGVSGEIVLWDVASGFELGRLKGHQRAVKGLAFFQDNRRLVSAGDSSIRFWDWRAAAELEAITNLSADAIQPVLSRDDQKLAILTAGQQAPLFDLRARAVPRQLRGHTRQVLSAAFAPDGKRLITGSRDGTVRVWDAGIVTPEPTSVSIRQGLATFAGDSGPALALSPDATRLLAVYRDGLFRLWDTASLTEGAAYRLPVKTFSCAAVAPAGAQATFADDNGNVVAWNPATGQTNWFGQAATSRVFRMAYSRDGRWLAFAGGEVDVSVSVWNVSEQRERCHFSTAASNPMSLAFSSDANHLLVGCFSGEVKLWSLLEPGHEIALQGHKSQVNGVTFLSAGNTVVGTAEDIRFWDARSGQPTDVWTPRETTIENCLVSPDGRRLVMGESFGIVRVWDLASRQELLTLHGHVDPVERLGFLPDGGTLVSVSTGNIRLWKAAASTHAEPNPIKR